MADMNKLKSLMTRVYNNKIIQNDEQNDVVDIKAYCEKVFGSNMNPDPTMLHQFNNLIVETANEIARPIVTDIVSLFAKFETKNRGDIVKYEIPQNLKAKVKWVANGVGIDAVRIDSQKYSIINPATFGAAFYYEPLDVSGDAVAQFNAIVDKLVKAKLDLYLKQITSLVDKAVLSGTIPAANVIAGSALVYKDYQKLANRIARYGGRPIFVADTLLIDYFAGQIETAKTPAGLSDRLKDMFLSELNITELGRTTAVNLVNPFIEGSNNTKVELPINKGYMFSSAQNLKPFVVIEYGTMRQKTKENFEDDRIVMKITQDAGIELLQGETVGIVNEQSNAIAL